MAAELEVIPELFSSLPGRYFPALPIGCAIPEPMNAYPEILAGELEGIGEVPRKGFAGK